MTTKHRAVILLVFLALFGLSLACTLGGPAAEATATTVAQVTLPPTSAGVTLPPTAITSLPTPSDTPAPTTPPTDTPTATATPIVGSGPGGCVLRGTYIADVTIPDGTLLSPNAPFVKTWRVRNDGTCQWDAGYQIVFAEGNQMGGPAAASIPAAGPGETKDISVNLVSPGATGDFVGRWRLRASNGAIFGGYTVVIKVVGTPTPTPTPTKTPTLTGGGVWGGAWDTNYGVMTLVQAGNSVTGFYKNGAGSVNGTISGNLLSGFVTEGGTTDTFDFWIEGTGLRWHGNWGKSNAWCGHRAGQTDLTPCGVSTWYGVWSTNCESGTPCGDMSLTQVGDTVSGTYAGTSGSVSGTVNGSVLSGTWRRNPGSPTEVSGSFRFFISADGKQFQGNFNTSSYWCGNRAGSSLPSPCLKN